MGKGNGLRNPHANFLRPVCEPLAQLLQHCIDIANQPRTFMQEKLSGIRDHHTASRPLEQSDTEPKLHSLHLPGDGALRQPCLLRCPGKRAISRDKLQ